MNRERHRERWGAVVYQMFGLLTGFASFWFIVAASQTFESAALARPYTIAGAVTFGAPSIGLFWLGQQIAERADNDHDSGEL